LKEEEEKNWNDLRLDPIPTTPLREKKGQMEYHTMPQLSAAVPSLALARVT
jgi:hypothetical protein